MKKKKGESVLEKKVEELTGLWKRALADYHNLEKRVNEERLRLYQEASKELIIKLLPALDGLERATKFSKDKGLELVLKHFDKVLENEGLQKIEVLGKEFNPQEMECIEVAKCKPGEENRVVQEIRPGYKFKDKIIRVAQVKVGKEKQENQAEEKAKPELLKGNYM